MERKGKTRWTQSIPDTRPIVSAVIKSWRQGWKRAAALAFVVTGLSACDTVSNVTDRFGQPPVIMPCPDYRILADAAKLVKFRAGGQDLTDVEYEGRMENMNLTCVTHVDRDTRDGTVDVTIEIEFSVARGAANRDRRAVFPYIVAVADAKRRILYREKFDIAVSFEGNRNAFAFKSNPLTLEFAVNPDRTTKDFFIIGAFEVSKEQLRFNHERRARSRR